MLSGSGWKPAVLPEHPGKDRVSHPKTRESLSGSAWPSDFNRSSSYDLPRQHRPKTLSQTPATEGTQTQICPVQQPWPEQHHGPRWLCRPYRLVWPRSWTSIETIRKGICEVWADNIILQVRWLPVTTKLSWKLNKISAKYSLKCFLWNSNICRRV